MQKFSSPLKVCFPFENKTLGGSYYAMKLLLDRPEMQAIVPVIVTHQKGPWSGYLKKEYPQYFIELNIQLPFSQSSYVTSILNFFRTVLSLVYFIRSNKIDLVHTNEESTAIVWSLACKIARIPHVWHQHALPSKSRITQYLRNRADVVLSISDYISKHIEREGRHVDLTVRNSFTFDREDFLVSKKKSEERKLLGLSSDDVVLMFVGSLTEQKRPMQAIKVCAELNENEKQGNSVHLLIFGDDRAQMQEELRHYAESLEVTRNVHYMGVRKKLAPFYQISDFLLAPAVGEGFGRALVEAMFFGCVVVAAASGGHKEIVIPSETGFLTEVDNSNAMSAVISSCLSNPNHQQKIRQSAQNFVKNFTDQKQEFSALLNLYRATVFKD